MTFPTSQFQNFSAVSDPLSPTIHLNRMPFKHPFVQEPSPNIIFDLIHGNQVISYHFPLVICSDTPKMKKMAPETSKTPEVKTTYGLKPLMDTQAQIFNPICAYHLVDLYFYLFRNHVKGEYPFHVVESSLYYQVTPFGHHFPKFISWLVAVYIDKKKYFDSSSRTKILKVTLKFK